MSRTKGSKNKVIKQKQTQKQVVNVNINQPEKKKRKPRTKKPKPEQQIIKVVNDKPLINYGDASIGKPSDNLYYSRQPTVVQVIPSIESSALLPPNDTPIEKVLQNMKIKTEKLIKKDKKLTDSGTEEILNLEPSIPKKKELIKEPLSLGVQSEKKIRIPKKEPFKLTGEILQRKNTDMQTEKKKLTDTGPNEVFNITSKVDDYKKIITKANQDMSGIIKKLSKLKKKTVEPPIKETSSIGTETILTGPTYEEKQKAAETINAIVKRNKTQEAFKKAKAAQKLVDAAKRVRIQKGYIRKRDKKEQNKFKRVEEQLNYVEGVLNKVKMNTEVKPFVYNEDFNIKKQDLNALEYASKPKNNYSALLKQRQLVDEEQLKQAQLAKDKEIKDDAAKKLQATIKRQEPQKKFVKVKEAKNIIAGFTKALLTEKPKRDENTGNLIFKPTTGQKLRVATRGKNLVSQKRQEAGIKSFKTKKEKEEINKEYLSLVQKYKPIMKKKPLKVASSK